MLDYALRAAKRRLGTGGRYGLVERINFNVSCSNASYPHNSSDADGSPRQLSVERPATVKPRILRQLSTDPKGRAIAVALEEFLHDKHMYAFLGKRVRVVQPPDDDSGSLCLMDKSGLIVGVKSLGLGVERVKVYDMICDDGLRVEVRREHVRLDKQRLVPVQLTLSAVLANVMDM